MQVELWTEHAALPAMDARDAYEIAIGSIFVVFIGWHLAASGLRARKRVKSWVHKNICQTVVTKRRRGSTDYTVASTLAIVALLCGNGVATFYRASDQQRLETRLGELASLNLVPLFLAGRSMLVVQVLCGISTRQYSILHRWLGWICVAQLSGFLYLSMARQGWHVDRMSIGVSHPSKCSPRSLKSAASIEPCRIISDIHLVSPSTIF